MEIQKFIDETSKGIIPIGTLATIAADRRAFGDDVITAFRTQIELRSGAAQTVLADAEKAGRDTLLASEQRSYDSQIRERDSILALQQAVERRTESRGFVPATQTERTETRAADTSPVLTHDVRMAKWLEARGGFSYKGESGASNLRLGALIAAMASGNRSHLSDIEKRALSEGTDSAGGYTVPEIVAAKFIDRVRDQLVVQRAGAQLVPMTSDTLHLARVAQPGISDLSSPTINAATGAWKVENELIEEATLELERVTLTARTLPILLKMSVELFEDGQNISQIVEQEMAASTALELDRVALVGSGVAPEPDGILNQANVQTDTLGSPLAADWDFVIDAAGLLWAENHEPNGMIYGTATAIALAKMKGSDDQPLTKPAALDGLRMFRTAAAGDRVFIGDFSQLLIGMRTSFRVEVSRTGAGAFERLQVAIRSYLRADIALAHPEAFVVLS